MIQVMLASSPSDLDNFHNSFLKDPSDTSQRNIVPSEPLEALFDGDTESSVTFRFPKKVRILRAEMDTDTSRQERGGRSYVGCTMILPSERRIRQLVVHAERLNHFDVQTRAEGEYWETRAQIRDNQDMTVVVKLAAIAKYVRIVALSDYRLSDGGDVGRNITKTYTSAPATICEVELYGWAD